MRIFSLVLFLLLSMSVQAGWQLEPSRSNVSFVTFKNTHLAEVHQFDQVKGSLSDTGELQLDIALASVNTGIPIRDSRMKSMLFNLNDFATAKISAKIDPAVLGDLSAQGRQVEIPFVLSLNGHKKSLTVTLYISKRKGHLIANSIKPVLLYASDYKLNNGIEALRAIAALNNISYSVPVNFHLSFTQSSQN